MRRALAISMWLLLPLFLTSSTGCEPPPQEAEAAPLVQEQRRSLVETVVLESVSFEEILELNGETEPVRFAEITAQSMGRIIDFDLEVGDRVERRDRVLRLNVSQSRARIDTLQVDLAQTESEIDRARRLINRGLATESDLERLEARRDGLMSGISEVETGMSESTTRAPISGIVTETYKEEGEFVAPGMPVARIVDISTIIVKVGLRERDIGFVTEGQEISVRIEALGETFVGTLERIGLEANTLNRTFPLEIYVDNSDGRLRSGMRATALVPRLTFDRAIVLPRDAILQALGGAEVFVNEEGITRARPVELGPSKGLFVVVSSGLSEGEEVIVRGHRTLVQGEPIEVTRSTPCCADRRSEPTEEPGQEPTQGEDGSSESTDGSGELSDSTSASSE